MRKDNTYNGHKNWNHWNVSLWLFNDGPMYRSMVYAVKNNRTLDGAAHEILISMINCYGGQFVRDNGEIDQMPYTPDGAPFTFTSIRAALRGWEW